MDGTPRNAAFARGHVDTASGRIAYRERGDGPVAHLGKGPPQPSMFGFHLFRLVWIAQDRHRSLVPVGGIGQSADIMAKSLHLGGEMQELAGEVLVNE